MLRASSGKVCLLRLLFKEVYSVRALFNKIGSGLLKYLFNEVDYSSLRALFNKIGSSSLRALPNKVDHGLLRASFNKVVSS